MPATTALSGCRDPPSVIVMSEARPLLTTGELARALGISRETIRRYHRSGDLTPTETTPAGWPKWIEADVREQMRALQERLRRANDGE
jgi:predicted DNA-binding transcriptional regulator AlpA